MKAALLIVGILAFLIPIVLIVIWSIKTKTRPLAYVTGAFCFFGFAYGLEAIAHLYFLGINESSSAFITNSLVPYVLYGGLMAGIFEETARLFGFKVILKKRKTKENSVAYGIGHGGIECILTLGITYLTYAAFLIEGTSGNEILDQQYLSIINSIDASIMVAAVVERISALILHISLSIIMYKACLNKKNLYLYPISILIHALADTPAALYQFGAINSIVAVEIATLIVSLVIMYFAIKTYKSLGEEKC